MDEFGQSRVEGGCPSWDEKYKRGVDTAFHNFVTSRVSEYVRRMSVIKVAVHGVFKVFIIHCTLRASLFQRAIESSQAWLVPPGGQDGARRKSGFLLLFLYGCRM